MQTADQLAQRIVSCGLLSDIEVEEVLASVGGARATRDQLERALTRQGLLTNWQLQRLNEGHRFGFSYGNWKILYLVGAGTFARVYRASHMKTGDVRAVKVLRNRYTDDEVTRSRFLREARTVMRLRHPNIVPIYEVEVQRNRLYMVMEFVEGQNLRDFLRTHKRLKLMTALNIIRDVCNGLDYAMKMGVVHRDVKLSNVLLSSDGRASLVDFGLAAYDENREGDEVAFVPRSVDYAGLEKTTGAGRQDKRSDIYFVGVLLYYMLSGKSPLAESRERMKRMSPQRFQQVEPLSNLIPDLPHRVVTLVNRLMELNPQNRLQTPADALAETNALMEALEAGEAGTHDARLSAQSAQDYSQRTRQINEGANHTLMIVESHTAIQDVLRQKLKRLGYRVLIFNDPYRALDRFNLADPAEALPADCVVIGCAGLRRQGVEAFELFGKHPVARTLPTILIAGSDLADVTSKLDCQPNQVLLGLPIEFPVLRKKLRELLGIAGDAELETEEAAER